MTDATVIEAPRSLWLDVWAQFRAHRGAMVGLFVLIFLLLFVLVGPLFWTKEPILVNSNTAQMFKSRNLGASLTNPLGTDQVGRDIMARLMLGGKVSLAVGFVAMGVAIGVGTLIGVLAGYFRALDNALMRLTDMFLSLPLLPLLLVLVYLYGGVMRAEFGPNLGTFFIIVAGIGLTSWMHVARIVRGQVLAVKEREFVLAARSIGTPSRRIITRHILPNVLSPVMVAATLGIANAIITESVLSFLGQGFQPDFPTWGSMLNYAYNNQSYPVQMIWPGLAISLTVLSVNYIGDGLRDALDPRIRGR
ncbi:ABC transporter permease [Xinfangfangia pollutisoli]|uniref:ABC transporter permease n=1 Tax=Xinfangfangia pollutisoli TaxID=2865960 RepID=UPI001CD3CEFE|nr:ABC transporter permease [Xinfangfangia pollutisoli]